MDIILEDCLGSIAGRIRLNGQPAAGLEAVLWPKPYRYVEYEKSIATVKTDRDGRYHFTEIPTGFYWISVHAPGYLNPDQWDDEGPGRNVSVADGQSVENADLDLILGGVITGRVLDVAGDPVVNEYVELIMLREFGPPEETMDLPSEDYDFHTDSNGGYRIYGIPPGRYLVSVGFDVAKVTDDSVTRDGSIGWSHQTLQKIDEDHYFEQTFHPGVNDRTRAGVIDISAGAEVHNVNLTVGKVFRAYAASGRVIDAERREPIRLCYIQVGQSSPRGGYVSQYEMNGPSDTDHNGNFKVEGLLPGRFFVSARFEGETELYCTPVEFEIKDRDINGLEIRAQRGLTLEGSVIVEGTQREEVAAKLAQLKIRTFYWRQGVGHDFREAAVKVDGSFTVRGLRTGGLQLDLGFEEANKYFSLVRIEYPDDGGDMREIRPAPWWDWRHTASIPIREPGLSGVQVVVDYHNGRIKGEASITGGKLDLNTRLQIGISSRYDKGGTWGTSMNVDPNGNFSIKGLVPGEYEISIYDEARSFYETKRVIVNKNCESLISFAIDLSARNKTD